MDFLPFQVSKLVGPWLPHCLRNVRSSYKVFIELDLPGQALDIIKVLTTDLRIQCLQVITPVIFHQVFGPDPRLFHLIKNRYISNRYYLLLNTCNIM